MGSVEVVALSDQDLIDMFGRRLPELLERRPDLQPTIFKGFAKAFATHAELAAVLEELRAFRAEVDERFKKVDERFKKVDERFDEIDERFDEIDERFKKVDERFDEIDERFKKVDERFDEVDERFKEVHQRLNEIERSIDRLGSRWGIRNESLFRQTMAALLEESFGVTVEQRTIGGEQFDVLIYDHQHLLVEIAASVGRSIRARLERKRRLYEESTGVAPTRVMLATASIHSRRAAELRQAGIEVIEPEEED